MEVHEWTIWTEEYPSNAVKSLFAGTFFMWVVVITATEMERNLPFKLMVTSVCTALVARSLARWKYICFECIPHQSPHRPVSWRISKLLLDIPLKFPVNCFWLGDLDLLPRPRYPSRTSMHVCSFSHQCETDTHTDKPCQNYYICCLRGVIMHCLYYKAGVII